MSSLHQTPSAAPLLVYGADESYYTGKLEAYLRAKGIDYRAVPFTEGNLRRAARVTGVMQIPQVECADGGWLVDTTPIIDYFEDTRPDPAIRPRAPVVAFVSKLLEDYADEWLWRPAMHFRWSYPDSARLMSGWLAAHVSDYPGPFALKRVFWYARQWLLFVRRDGVNRTTRPAVEASYCETLEALESILRRRPFVLGARPTEADFGFFGSMFRHFFCDPASGRIMRQRAPAVLEWVARLWNLRPERFADAPQIATVPTDVQPLLDAVANIYLPYLKAMAAAYARGHKRVSYRVQGVDWREPVKPYRVWCLAQLQQCYAGLDGPGRADVSRLLGGGEAAALLAGPQVSAPIPVAGPLPLRQPVATPPADSWWRGR